ncbi:SPFH domain / Band 7 family protein [Paenibacillus sp. UNCCL117]|uniref:slipin family protein n=1 Tax=unclassified Paenibacillus TaxID=185978 RepID=UPI000890E708|nr:MULTISPECIES: slipin family protein [unclassified Paenibacillus]SDE48459.1 SPFH domain / Band 7 family protein [Paenibacillus sp. cl123]SFW66669.1 SPFH domain / Band 7 family protein [Paenibacillus sp. UNCCL117]
MFNKVIIQADQRGLLFHKGSYVKKLNPGTYRYFMWSQTTVVVMNIANKFAIEGKDLQLFLHDADLVRELDIVRVPDHEYVLHYEDGQFVQLLKPGVYAYWNVLKKHAFLHTDIRKPELPSEVDRSIIPKLAGHIQSYEIASCESGFLFYDHVLQRELSPGKYYFWKGPVSVTVKSIDLRQQQMDLIGQEIMTEDKVTLRLNFVCQYKIVQPLRALEMKSFDEQIHIQLQLMLREYVGTLKLDDLLKRKEDIASFILSRIRDKSEEFGVQFLSAGVKDVILPGEMKDILSTVLLAEKKAQANLITRREETASTRSLLNTAKLMDENQTLFRLKELEFLEKICEKIGSISLTGGGDLLERLSSLIGEKGTASK